MLALATSPLSHSAIAGLRGYGPSLPRNVTRAGSNTDTTPDFSASALTFNNASVLVEFELFKDGSSIGTVDSDLVPQGGTVTAEFANTLPLGFYEVQARTMEDGGKTSFTTEPLTFVVSQYVAPVDVQLQWHVLRYVLDQLELNWNVTVAGVRDFNLRWRVKGTVTKDLRLRWRLITPWRRVDYNEHDWERVNYGNQQFWDKR